MATPHQSSRNQRRAGVALTTGLFPSSLSRSAGRARTPHNSPGRLQPHFLLLIAVFNSFKRRRSCATRLHVCCSSHLLQGKCLREPVRPTTLPARRWKWGKSSSCVSRWWRPDDRSQRHRRLASTIAKFAMFQSPAASSIVGLFPLRLPVPPAPAPLRCLLRHGCGSAATGYCRAALFQPAGLRFPGCGALRDLQLQCLMRREPLYSFGSASMLFLIWTPQC